MLIEKTELCKLALKYGSDKAPDLLHSYTPVYYELFKNKRNIKKVLEIGIGYPELMRSISDHYVTGASLFMWRDFFPEAIIYGADIKRDILIIEDRIKSFYVDQSSEESLKILSERVGNDFDLIIDDGSHTVDHQILTVKILSQCLSYSGIYIIEDVLDLNKLLPALFEFNIEIKVGRLKIAPENDIIVLLTKRR